MLNLRVATLTQPELVELPLVDGSGRAGHQAGRAGRLGKSDNLADRLYSAEHGADPIKAQRDPSVGWRAGLERAAAWMLALGETARIAHTLHLGAEVVSDPLRLVARARFSLDPMYIEFTFRDHPDLGGDHLLVVGWYLP